MSYKHRAGIDFTYCEHGQCKYCTTSQQRKCEQELDKGLLILDKKVIYPGPGEGRRKEREK